MWPPRPLPGAPQSCSFGIMKSYEERSRVHILDPSFLGHSKTLIQICDMYILQCLIVLFQVYIFLFLFIIVMYIYIYIYSYICK